MPEGETPERAKGVDARIIGIIIFRILAVGAWLFALLFIIAGFQVNLLGVIFGVIVAAVLASWAGALGHRRHGQRPRKDSSRKTRGPGGKRPRHRNRHGQRA